jgi:catechol-2,3-dioxygenase
MKVDGIFEVAIKVKDLDVSAKFYQDVIGFKKGLYDQTRRWLFLWVGTNNGMLVLQEDKENFSRQHFAFAVQESDLNSLKEILEKSNVLVEGPVSLDWMNAVSLYFADPDGHDVEFCAIRKASTLNHTQEA